MTITSTERPLMIEKHVAVACSNKKTRLEVNPSTTPSTSDSPHTPPDISPVIWLPSGT
jgi:hypothetical protein